MADEPTAGDVMSDGVIAIEQDATVQDAATLMREEDIRSLVIVDDSDAVGILVGRDIVYKVIAEGRDAAETPVKDVMTPNLVTAAEDDRIGEIARSMIEYDISRVPILRGDTVVGIVTQSNIMRAWPSYVDLMQEEFNVYG